MRTRNVVLPLLALAAAAGGGWALKKRLFPDKGTRMEARVVKARVMPIADTIEAEGAVAPFHRVEIKPTTTGRVEKMLVNEGDTVRRGQIIAWMSSSDRAAILDSAQAQGPEEVKRWEDAYLATPVIAPLPGLIILSNVVEGQTVDPSLVIYAMSDLLIVVAQVDESDIGRVHVGMPAKIVLDSYPDRSVTGKVFDVLYEGKNTSNVIQYTVKIKLPQVPAYYRSQMTANISFIVSQKEKALLVPADAVRERDGGRQVLVPGADGSGEWQDVETGIENDKWVEITDGLAPGDSVMIRQAPYTRQQASQSSPFASPAGGGGGRGGGGGGRGRRGG